MAVVATQVSVGTTATKLTVDQGRDGSSILVQAPAGGTLYVGGEGVTTATGFPIAAGSSLTVDLRDHEHLYGVLAAAASVPVLRLGV